MAAPRLSGSWHGPQLGWGKAGGYCRVFLAKASRFSFSGNTGMGWCTVGPQEGLLIQPLRCKYCYSLNLQGYC